MLLCVQLCAPLKRDPSFGLVFGTAQMIQRTLFPWPFYALDRCSYLGSNPFRLKVGGAQ